ncbi:hypothetical protein KIH74_09020 [Kineosporia sp. J2-2]|uniref:Uncharacterized protein n=1 Tax=Kineosporia corallincola TaxID=2835133 RepID=A0ABS5TD92_9ACTN|nr:hypothetical protein [Kineosporia corallincola]MBT0769065.1 hypothetical protein [Kineosporia corallincola]
MPRTSIVVVDDFYRDPLAIRDHALGRSFYTPYESDEDVASGRRPTWWASRFEEAGDCPVKSSKALTSALEDACGETIDRSHWEASYPRDGSSRPLPGADPATRGCLWNTSFHVKPDNGQVLGDGVHNHVTDDWNGVGPDGWAGIVYLSPGAPPEGGLHLWRNVDARRRHDWMTPRENWRLIDSLGNVFNRLLLVRGDVPHSGARGWGNRLEEGRLYQTFFFRTHPESPGFRREPVEIEGVG